MTFLICSKGCLLETDILPKFFRQLPSLNWRPWPNWSCIRLPTVGWWLSETSGGRAHHSSKGRIHSLARGQVCGEPRILVSLVKKIPSGVFLNKNTWAKFSCSGTFTIKLMLKKCWGLRSTEPTTTVALLWSKYLYSICLTLKLEFTFSSLKKTYTNSLD